MRDNFSFKLRICFASSKMSSLFFCCRPDKFLFILGTTRYINQIRRGSALFSSGLLFLYVKKEHQSNIFNINQILYINQIRRGSALFSSGLLFLYVKKEHQSNIFNINQILCKEGTSIKYF
jgi:hypothetical protein